jgi:hypothetical protein
MILSIIVVSCSEKRGKNEMSQLIPIDINLSNMEESYDIANDVSSDWDIVALETQDESLINYINKIIYANNQYYVLDKGIGSIFIFDENGNFLRKLHKIGNGPDEYVSIASFTVIDENVWIVDENTHKLICYDKELNMLEKTNTMIQAFDIVNLHQDIYMATNWIGFENENCQLCKYNIEEKKSECFYQGWHYGPEFCFNKQEQSIICCRGFLFVFLFVLRYYFSNKGRECLAEV